MKKLLWIPAIMIFVTNVYAAETSELDPLHQLLDQVEQAWQQHDLSALTDAYWDKSFLLIADTPNGALVLNRAQALKSISNYWTQVKTHQFVGRNIWIDHDLAWMHLKIADRKNDRSYPISENLVCAIKTAGKWKICFGMPAFFQPTNPIKSDGSAQLIQADQPHPIKDLMIDSFKGFTKGNIGQWKKIIYPKGFFFPIPSEGQFPPKIYSYKEAQNIWYKKIKDFPKDFDLSKATLDNINILAAQNVAIASGFYTWKKSENEKISLPTPLSVFVQLNDSWTMVAELPFKYEIALTNTNAAVLTSSQLEEKKQQWKGRMCGIGVQLEKNPKGVLIKNVISDSPASLSGLTANEVITEINGQPTINLSVNDAVNQIKGQEGTAVNLKILNAAGESRKLAITRKVFRVSGATATVLKNNVGLITISSFNNETFFDVKNALDKFYTQDVRGIVLDLRENQGGMAGNIKQVAELFVTQGTKLWMFKVKNQPPKWIISSGSYDYKFKIAVLINEKTQGGELLASALKGKPGITIIGRKSSGAASLRGLEKQPGNQTKIVDHGIFLSAPNEPITGQGVKPDIAFKTDLTAQEQLDRAVKEVRTAIR